jgi:hypothetical protein
MRRDRKLVDTGLALKVKRRRESGTRLARLRLAAFAPAGPLRSTHQGPRSAASLAPGSAEGELDDSGPPEEQCLEPVLLRKQPFHGRPIYAAAPSEGRSGSPIAFERAINRQYRSSPRRSPSCFSQNHKKKKSNIRLARLRSAQIRCFRVDRPFVIDAPGPGVDRQTHSGLRGGRTRRQRTLPKNNVSNPFSVRRHPFHGERSEHRRSFRGSVGEPERFRTRY